MKRRILPIILLCFPILNFCQDLTGYWQGTMEHTDCPNAVTSKYPLLFTLQQNGTIITGEWEIRIPGSNAYAKFSLTNSYLLLDTYFSFSNGYPIEQIPPPNNWCHSHTGNLEYNDSENTLTGTASGLGSFGLPVPCCKSKIWLKRLVFNSDTIFCQGEEISLNATGDFIRWFAEDTKDLLHTGNTYTTTIDAPFDVYITQQINGGITIPVQFNIGVYEPSFSFIDIQTESDCNGFGGQIEISMDNTESVLLGLAPDNLSSNKVFENLSAGNYSVYIEDEFGCLTIEEAEIISKSLYFGDVSINEPNCNASNGEIRITPTGSQGDFEVAIGGAPFQEALIFQDISAGDYQIFLRDGLCIIDTTITVLEKDCPILFPNVFTPNADGVNDLFRPIIPENYRGSIASFSIWNRWGENVFNYDPSMGAFEGWSGITDGKHHQSDVYFYILEMRNNNGSTDTHKGNFSLIR